MTVFYVNCHFFNQLFQKERHIFCLNDVFLFLMTEAGNSVILLLKTLQ